jgi:hypothetical protein
MGALPNLFNFEIATALERGEGTPEGIAAALASSEPFLKAIQLGIEEAEQKQFHDNDIIAILIRSTLGKAFSAPTADSMF